MDLDELVVCVIIAALRRSGWPHLKAWRIVHECN